MISLTPALETIRQAMSFKPLEVHSIYLGSQTAEDDLTLHYANFYKTVNFFTYLSEEAQVYQPLAIKRSTVKKSTQGEINKITYTVDNVNRGVSAYAARYNFRNKRIATRLIFRDQLSDAANAMKVFDGKIQTIKFLQKKKTRTVSITAAPAIGSLSFTTGWPYEINCNCRFGDEFCKQDKDDIDNRIDGTATSGSDSTLVDTTNLVQADGYWNTGVVYFTSGDNNGLSRRVIDFDEPTSTIILDVELATAIVAGDTYYVRRGCDKTLTVCESTFENDENYHGYHTLPLRKIS